MYNWLHEVAAPVSALVGAYGGFLLRGIEYRRDRLNAYVEDIITEIRKLQSVNTTYWSVTRSAADRGHEDLAQEGEMLGRIHIINMMVEKLTPVMSNGPSAGIIRASVIDLRQSTTGGEFADDRGRSANTRAIHAGFRASHELILALRDAHARV